MGLFSSIAGSVASKLAGGENGQIIQLALDILKRHHGVPGVLDKFRQAGCGAEVDSWLSDGPNLPLTPGQVEKTLGLPELADIGSKFGITGQEVADKMARYLPTVVDRLSPNGQVPKSEAELIKRALSIYQNW